MVICEVTVEALRAISGLENPSTEELAGIFEIHREVICDIASAKFDAGDHRPLVAAADLVGAVQNPANASA